MQFIKNGPEIPNEMLHAHEDDKLVFFCGAGISLRAGLVDYAELTKKLFDTLKPAQSLEEIAAIKDGQFDRAIGLLESDKAVLRKSVRKEIVGIIRTEPPSEKEMKTHKSILDLSTDRSNRTRLVTTNFDQLFQHTIKHHGHETETFAAPLLPIPNKHWNGIVHLHGQIDKSPPNSLVVTSGDFGLAYLFERWAARFVSELFRHYSICFIGYSINDPILRYMVDAAAMDISDRDKNLNTFALCGYNSKTKSTCVNYWRARNVVPIPYNFARKHAALHNTLAKWAKTYCEDALGKSRIVKMHARRPPTVITKKDDHVGRVLWAISDKSGEPAKAFAELDPPPTLEWLTIFSENRFTWHDLKAFGVEPGVGTRKNTKFSLINRPTPSHLAYRMSVFHREGEHNNWDRVMCYIFKWLLNHIYNPDLFFWVIRGNIQLHPILTTKIRKRLQDDSRRELDKSNVTSNHSFSQGSLTLLMTKLWNLYVDGKVECENHFADNYEQIAQLKSLGINSTTRVTLISTLRPLLNITPFRSYKSAQDNQKKLVDIASIKIVLSDTDIQRVIEHIKRIHADNWKKSLPELLTFFTFLLQDALDLLKTIGEANHKSDRSYSYRPSIGPHPQNRYAQSWTILVDLIIEAWTELAAVSQQHALITAESWMTKGYPIFIRLALYAATHKRIVPSETAINWLLSKNHTWLWSVETKREVMRFLVLASSKFKREESLRLTNAILEGPSTGNSESDEMYFKSSVFSRLQKLKEGGVKLNDHAERIRVEIQKQFVKMKEMELLKVDDSPLEYEYEDEHDEFPIYRSGPQWKKRKQIDLNTFDLPSTANELSNWLQSNSNRGLSDAFFVEVWKLACKTKLDLALSTLAILPKRTLLWTHCWNIAFQVWVDSRQNVANLEKVSDTLISLSSKQFDSLLHNICIWIEEIVNAIHGYDVKKPENKQLRDQLIRLIERIFKYGNVGSFVFDEDPAIESLSHSFGYVTKSALQLSLSETLSDSQGLPSWFKNIFENLSNLNVKSQCAAFFVLASSAVTLSKFDSEWTEKFVLRHFRWRTNSTFARYSWAGFLQSQRYNFQVMNFLNRDFLITAENYNSLGSSAVFFSETLTYTALMQNSPFPQKSLAKATESLPDEGLLTVAKTILEAFKSTSKERRSTYLKESIMPYMTKIWPKIDIDSSRYKSSQISEHVGYICLESECLFGLSVELLSYWLTKIDYPWHMIETLCKHEYCKMFPQHSLRFLYKIVDPNGECLGISSDHKLALRACLDEIKLSHSCAASTQEYMSLDKLALDEN